jgi:hypothetical protein
MVGTLFFITLIFSDITNTATAGLAREATTHTIHDCPWANRLADVHREDFNRYAHNMLR